MANLHLIIVLSKLIQNICDSGILVSGSKLIFLNVASLISHYLMNFSPTIILIVHTFCHCLYDRRFKIEALKWVAKICCRKF